MEVDGWSCEEEVVVGFFSDVNVAIGEDSQGRGYNE